MPLHVHYTCLSFPEHPQQEEMVIETVRMLLPYLGTGRDVTDLHINPNDRDGDVLLSFRHTGEHVIREIIQAVEYHLHGVRAAMR